MLVLGRAVRWIAAVATFVTAFFVSFALVIALFSYFDAPAAGASRSYLLGVAFATYMGILAGTLIVPSGTRRLASRLFVAAVAILTVGDLLFSLLNRTFQPTNFYDVAGCLIGGLLVLRTLNQVRATKGRHA